MGGGDDVAESRDGVGVAEFVFAVCWHWTVQDLKELFCGEERLVRLADGWDGAMGGVERVGACVGAGLRRWIVESEETLVEGDATGVICVKAMALP